MIKRRYDGRTYPDGRRCPAALFPLGVAPPLGRAREIRPSPVQTFLISAGGPSVRPSIHVIPEQQLETDRRRRRLLVMQDSGGTGTEGGREAGWRASKVGCPGYRFFRGKYARFTPRAVENGRPASGRRQVASGVPSPSFPPSKSYAYFVVSLPIPRDRARLGGQF